MKLEDFNYKSYDIVLKHMMGKLNELETKIKDLEQKQDRDMRNHLDGNHYDGDGY